jgi:hypothetical protein
MNARLIECLAAVYLVLFLSGCGRLIDWGTNTFYQGETLEAHNKEAWRFVRWGAVYDQLETRAIFDAIWLSDDVRTAYAHLFMARQGKSEEHHTAFLRRQLEENNHFITFYVLSLYKIPLGDPDSAWSLFLDVDGKQVLPLEIKAVDLPQEFQTFFGKRFTRFKDAYLVKFDARDVEEHPFITKDTHVIALNFKTIDKQLVLSWKFGPDGRVMDQPMTGGVPKFIYPKK